jgi:hypothetical protein
MRLHAPRLSRAVDELEKDGALGGLVHRLLPAPPPPPPKEGGSPLRRAARITRHRRPQVLDLRGNPGGVLEGAFQARPPPPNRTNQTCVPSGLNAPLLTSEPLYGRIQKGFL